MSGRRRSAGSERCSLQASSSTASLELWRQPLTWVAEGRTHERAVLFLLNSMNVRVICWIGKRKSRVTAGAMSPVRPLCMRVPFVHSLHVPAAWWVGHGTSWSRFLPHRDIAQLHMFSSVCKSSWKGKCEETRVLDKGEMWRDAISSALQIGANLLFPAVKDSFSFVLQGGNYVVNLLDSHGAPISILLICFLEAVAVSWCYGTQFFSLPVSPIFPLLIHVCSSNLLTETADDDLIVVCWFACKSWQTTSNLN